MMYESFNPVYNSVEQVKNCASYMLGEKVVEARIALVIGHNGRNFVSSTDWRLTTESGAHRILPFSMRPQYPNFLECVAGVSYEVKNGKLRVEPDNIEKLPSRDYFGNLRGSAAKKMREKRAVVKIGEKSYEFEAGKALKIYVEPNTEFIATDCAVKYEERKRLRVFEVLTNEQTVHGFLDERGIISQLGV